MIRLVSALLAGFAVLGVASAEELRPMEAQSISLGELVGTAYYTVVKDGYQVVATVAAGETGAPMRFVATLVAGQRVVLSVPRAVDEPSIDLEIARVGDAVFVSESAAIASLN